MIITQMLESHSYTEVEEITFGCQLVCDILVLVLVDEAKIKANLDYSHIVEFKACRSSHEHVECSVRRARSAESIDITIDLSCEVVVVSFYYFISFFVTSLKFCRKS